MGSSTRKYRPAKTIEGRENQIINAAMDLAEKRILNGTASSMEITHFLKMGSSTERMKREIMSLEKDHLKAKTEAIKNNENFEVLYQNAIKAITGYKGEDDYD